MLLPIIILLLTILVFAGHYMTTSNEKPDFINPDSVKAEQAKGKSVVIDVRTPEEFSEGHLKLVDYNYDYKSGVFKQKLDTLDQDKTYYLHCRSGNRSGKAATLMQQKGFERVYNIGGYEALVKAGFEPNK